MCTLLICSISREVFIVRRTHNFKLIDVAILWYVKQVSCFSATMGASCYPLDLSLYPILKFIVLFIILGSTRIYIGVCSLWQVMPLKQHRLIVDCVINACLQSTLSIQLCQFVYVDQFTAAYHLQSRPQSQYLVSARDCNSQLQHPVFLRLSSAVRRIGHLYMLLEEGG